jgi:hypothetical protein
LSASGTKTLLLLVFFPFFWHFNESESLSGTDFTGAQLRRSFDFPLLFGYVIFKHVCGRFRQIGSHYFSSLSRHLIDQQRRNWIRTFFWNRDLGTLF